MNFLTLITIFVAVSYASGKDLGSRITGGYSAPSGLIKCFVAMLIETENYAEKYCGGCVVAPGNKIVTAASCLITAYDGPANSVKFFTGLSGQAGFTNSQFKIKSINAAGDFIPSSNVSGSDIAVITLENSVTTTSSSYFSSSLEAAKPSVDDKIDSYVGQNLVVCGHGFIDNNRTRPGSRGLQCTTLRVVPVAECLAYLPKPATPAPPTASASGSTAAPTAAPATIPAPPPKGWICTKNNDDRNVCGGDQGSPVFSNKTGQLEFVGVVSFYPDARPNARCRDGHYSFITQVGAFNELIQNST